MDSRVRGNDGSGACEPHNAKRAHIPSEAATGRRKMPVRVASMEAGQFGVSPWMDCRQTPQPGRVPPGPMAREARKRGGLSLGYFSLATQREVTRPPKEDEKLLLWIRGRRRTAKIKMDSRVHGNDGSGSQRRESSEGRPGKQRDSISIPVFAAMKARTRQTTVPPWKSPDASADQLCAQYPGAPLHLEPAKVPLRHIQNLRVPPDSLLSTRRSTHRSGRSMATASPRSAPCRATPHASSPSCSADTPT